MCRLKANLTAFKEIIFYLKNIEIKYDDEDLSLILLYSLLALYSTFRDTIPYSHDSLTLDEVYDALFCKEKIDMLLLGNFKN